MTFKNLEALSAADKEKVLSAVDVLCENNKEIAAQLERLAFIKKNQPLIWKMALLKLKA
jgi:hypothetical protein